MRLDTTILWDALGWAVLHSLWQGALIGAVVWAIRTLLPERQAGLRYLFGIAGLIATLVAFLATFIQLASRSIGSASVVGNDPVVTGGPSETVLSITVLPDLSPLRNGSMDIATAMVPWLGMVWAIGFTCLGLQAWRAYQQTRFLATQGLSDVHEDWTARFSNLVRLSRTRDCVSLFISAHVSAPMTLGALKPIVLVPAGFLTAMPAAQVEAILLHELAHIRRHDFLIGLVQTAIRTLLYFNPAVILMSRQIDEDREQACDDFAVHMTGRPGDLARGLATLRLANRAPALAMAADGGPLLVRLNRLMGRPTLRSPSHRLSAAVMSVLMLGTAACGTVAMAHSASAEPPETAPETMTEEPEWVLSDTVVRGDQVIKGDAVIKRRDGTGPAIVLNAADMSTSSPTPPMPPMPFTTPLPAMPVMPPVPELPPLPAMPVPVFGEYENAEDFEAAMEAWSEGYEDRMDAWSEQVESRFEGGYERAMDDWEDAMEDWAEAFEETAKSNQVDTAWIHKDQAKRAIEQAQRQQQREFERSERQRERAEREQERVQREVERAIEKAQRHSAKMDRHSETSSRSRQVIRTFSDEAQKTIKINGRTVNIDDLRNRLRSSLFQDGLISNREDKIQLYLKGKVLKVNGRKATKEQARRYADLLGASGIDTSGFVSMKMLPDSTEFKVSGSSKDLIVTVGTHTVDK